jgi:hypothetical protein
MRPTAKARRSPTRLALLASASILVLALTAAPVSFDPVDGFAPKLAQAGKCCFVAGTKVRMADGSERPIEGLAPGDRVLGRGGRANRVLRLVRTRLGRRRLWSINGSRPFVTAEHPFLGQDGWRAIEPEATSRENPQLPVAPLRRGDTLVRLVPPAVPVSTDGTARQLDAAFVEQLEAVRVLLSITGDPDQPLFNLELDGDHTYVAEGWIVHNKGGDGGGSSGGGSSGDDDDDDDDGDRGGSSGRGGDDDDDDDRGGSAGDDDDDDDDDRGGSAGDDDDDDDDDDDRGGSSDDDDDDDDDDSSADDDRASDDDDAEDRVVAAAPGRSGVGGRSGERSPAGGAAGGEGRALSPAEERAAIARGWR